MIRRALAFPAPGVRSVAPDPVWLAVAVVLLTLFVLAPAQGEASLVFTVDGLWRVAPFLLASIVVAAWARASGADGLIAHAFRGRTPAMILPAALLGGLSPFCSCGVIPLIAALLAMGVPLPAVMAFWLASPVMDPSMFVLTAGVLGTPFALAKTAAAVGLGLLGGFGTLLLQRSGQFARPLRPGVGDGGCAGSRIASPETVVWRFWDAPARRARFAGNARSNLLFLGKWLTLAFLLESLMLSYLPAEVVAGVVGGGGWPTVLGAALAGVPAYLNGYAALPLVDGLMAQGMAPGAAMAFLVAGGVTSIPAAIAVYALARLPVFLAYLGFAFVGAMLAGLAWGALA